MMKSAIEIMLKQYFI